MSRDEYAVEHMLGDKQLRTNKLKSDFKRTREEELCKIGTLNFELIKILRI